MSAQQWDDEDADPMGDIGEWLDLLRSHQEKQPVRAYIRLSRTIADDLDLYYAGAGSTLQEAADALARKHGFRDGAFIEIVERGEDPT
jgi:hypothetical protein